MSLIISLSLSKRELEAECRVSLRQRRVRKDENEDEKCDAVANLLIQGKAGEVLEVEIKEQIASVTPGIDDPKKVKLAVKKGRR